MLLFLQEPRDLIDLIITASFQQCGMGRRKCCSGDADGRRDSATGSQEEKLRWAESPRDIWWFVVQNIICIPHSVFPQIFNETFISVL